jgi:hypothetical protein
MLAWIGVLFWVEALGILCMIDWGILDTRQA